MLYLILTFFLSCTVLSESGKVLKVVGGDTILTRNGTQSKLASEDILEVGDKIETSNGSALVLLYPATQISLSSNSQITISEHSIKENEVKERAVSVISFLKGFIKVMVSKDEDQEIDQRYEAKEVSFGVRGTEFELSEGEDGDIDLDVSEGEIEVSSPHVQTFVPEIVKANQGFRFSQKNKNFIRRKFLPKLRDRSVFQDRKTLLKNWKERKISKFGRGKLRSSGRKTESRQRRKRDR